MRIEAVTGALTADERRARVEDMADADKRLLVATDCLSEGINLQDLFDSVVHYDLSWNPTRHQQREGRVDRFGQPAPLVRSALLYSPDSAIDGAVLDVILRKAEAIRKATGVTVPLPEERGAVTGALMNAVLLRKRSQSHRQLGVRLRAGRRGDGDPLARRRGRGEAVARALRPERHQAGRGRARMEAMARAAGVAGGGARFVERAMSRIDAPLEAVGRQRSRRISRICRRPLSGADRRARPRGTRSAIAFVEPAPAGAALVTRSHPLPCDPCRGVDRRSARHDQARIDLGRVGAWPTPAVADDDDGCAAALRFKLTVHGRRERLLLVEEASALAFGRADGAPARRRGGAAGCSKRRRLAISLRSRGNACSPRRGTESRPRWTATIADYARTRADALAEDHARVRAAGSERPARQRGSRSAGRRGRTFRSPSGGALRWRAAPSAAPAFDALADRGRADRAGNAGEDRRCRGRRAERGDYRIPKGLTLRDEIARYFRIGQA